MRTKTILAMTVLASVTLAGCTKDNDNEMEVDRVKDTPMTFVTSVNQPATRAGYETGILPTDVTFGLTVATDGETVDERFIQKNKMMEYDGTSQWIEKAETTQLLWKNKETTVSYTAYMPYSKDAVNALGAFRTAYPIAIPEVQTAENIKAADFLYTKGTTTGSESAEGIPLAFKHTLSQFKITLARGSEIADGVTFDEVKLTGYLEFSTTIDLTSGTVGEGTVNLDGKTITLLDNGENTFECILVPQNFLNSNKVIITASDGKTYAYSPKEKLPFASGKTYTLPLTVGRDKVEAGTITAKPWDTNTTGGDLETE